MKVYVVTTGCYSDYCINSIFTNKDKAEDYAKWLEDANDVEEYEVDDVGEFDKNHKIHINLTYYDNGKESISIRVEKTIESHENQYSNYTSYSDYHKYGSDYFKLYCKRTVHDNNFNEDFYTNKFKKATYDILATVKQKRMEGYTEKQINQILGN